MSGFEQRDRPRHAVMRRSPAGTAANLQSSIRIMIGIKAVAVFPRTRPGDMVSFCRNANAEKTAIHCYLCTHWHIRFTHMPSFEAPWMQRSELGRKIPVDLEADADFDECRSCP
jgi:hypothetical protein